MARVGRGAFLMARSLADLKAKPKQLPTRTVRICLDLEALAAVQRLDAERRDLELESQQPAEGDQRPKRVGEGPNPRIAEIVAEIAALWDTMRESEGDLLLRAVSGGDWQRFKDDNPARENSKTDEAITYGICDSSALLADLGRYVVSWNAEPFEPGAWDDWFAAQVAPADLSELCSTVVQIHEARVVVPKALSTGSSVTPEPATS